jgi:hypothetical protein
VRRRVFGREVDQLSGSWLVARRTTIVFTRATKGTPSSIYTVNADGCGLSQVTNARGDSQPDWGPHPLAG